MKFSLKAGGSAKHWSGRWLSLCLLSSTLVCTAADRQPTQARALTIAALQWLEIQDMTGSAFFQTADGSGPVEVGARLQAVGDRIQTHQRSTAKLAIDTGIGFVTLAENTTLQIQSLTILPSGGRVTRLQVLGGQARLQVRPFNNPDSALEIETPAGWSGVRGTEFGVAVRPDGSTSVATIEGSVVTHAQGEQVVVSAGLQSTIVPGEPPLSAETLSENLHLDIEQMFVKEGFLYLSGKVEPVNLLCIGGVEQVLDREGAFSLKAPVSKSSRITAVVTTPLGTRQVYELVPF